MDSLLGIAIVGVWIVISGVALSRAYRRHRVDPGAVTIDTTDRAVLSDDTASNPIDRSTSSLQHLS